MSIFESGGLLFRLMEQSDTGVLYGIWGDADTMRFCGGIVNEERIADIIKHNKESYNKYSNAVFAVVSKKNGAFIGVCGGKIDSDDPKAAEVIIHLDKAFHGKGYGTEAVAAYVAWLKENNKATYVYASAHPGNAASINMLKKCGFTRNGFRQYEDTDFVDEPFFEMRL